MYLPNDIEMLVSIINTALRDKYSSISDLCYDEDVNFDEVNAKLNAAGYFYNEKINAYKKG